MAGDEKRDNAAEKIHHSHRAIVGSKAVIDARYDRGCNAHQCDNYGADYGCPNDQED
jgi:hypothetical protein